MSGLSKSIVHPYHPNYSNLQYRLSGHVQTLEGIFFWNKTRLILDSALWVYYVNFPMLFHPIDILRKYGYNGPIGIFADPMTNVLVERSLLNQDYQAFREYSSQQDVVISLLESISNQPDLKDEQICGTWNPEDGPLMDLREGYCKHMAKFRALRVAMSFREREKTNFPDGLIDAMQSLKGWEKISQFHKVKKIRI